MATTAAISVLAMARTTTLRRGSAKDRRRGIWWCRTMCSSTTRRCGSAKRLAKGLRHDHARVQEPAGALDRLPAAGIHLYEPRTQRIPDAAQSQLLVELRLARRDHAGRHDRHRRRPGDALHAACRLRLPVGRADHARRQLRLARALSAYEWGIDVLHRDLH